MPPNILTSHRGRTLDIRVTGPLDRRLASALFSRFLSAQSGYDELVLDLTDVEEVHDTGIAALRLLRNRAREAGKRLTILDCARHDCAGRASAPRERGTAANHFPWTSPPHGYGTGLQRAASRIAAPGRYGGVTRGALFPRAPMTGQAGAV
jgi:ABC-type transporter Mla MlaB component